MGKNREDATRKSDRANQRRAERTRMHKILFTPLRTAADLNALLKDPEVMATGREVESLRAKRFGKYVGPSIGKAEAEAAMANAEEGGAKSKKGRKK